MHAGTLPDSWGSAGAFPSLVTLTVFDMPLTGTLPASWAGNASFPALESLGLGVSDPNAATGCLSGPMPAEWGSSDALQLLQIMTIRACFDGNLPQQ